MSFSLPPLGEVWGEGRARDLSRYEKKTNGSVYTNQSLI